MTQIAWCKERGISRRTLGRWILGVKVSEIQSDSTADWVELNDCNPISSVSSGLHEAIEILVGKYAICVKPGFDREAMLDVCRILGEIC
jgi:hypothetical protein